MDMNGDHGPRVIRRSPLVLVVVPTMADAARLPVEVVESYRPRSGRTGWGLGLGVLLGLVLTLLLTGELPASLPEGLVRAVAFAAVLVVLAVNHRRGHPVGNAIGAALGLVGALLTGGSPAFSVVATALVGALTIPAWLGDRSRATWWPRLEGLLTEHRSASGVAHSVERVAASGRPYRYVVQVSTPDLPGFVWSTEEQSSPRYEPAPGDRVTIWYRPSDPEAAVLCVAGDEVSQMARARGVTRP
jgi:hypothetical protein